MTVRVLGYAGDGAYYLRDPAHELDGLRPGPVGAVLCGGHDRGVEAVVAAVCTRRRAVDVVIAAPKAVSLLLASEPTDVARRVVALHERAARAALAFLTKGTAADEVLAVGFTHGVSRLLDPHLHTHVLVGQRASEAGRSPGRRLRERARAADALYLAALREGLPHAASRAAWVGRSGATHVEGVDLGAVAATCAPRDRSGAVERGGPKRHPSRAEVRRRWDEALLASPTLGALAPRGSPSLGIDEHRFAVGLGTGLVRRADVVGAWAAACTFGDRPERVETAVELLRSAPAEGERASAAVVRDDPGVAVLGARPRDPDGLAAWGDGRRALDRYLAEHDARHVRDPQGAGAATRIALARLDAALADAGLPPRQRSHGRLRHRARAPGLDLARSQPSAPPSGPRSAGERCAGVRRT